MKTERPDTWQKLDELEQGTCKRIAFGDVWLLYPPGTTVYKKESGVWRAYKTERLSVQYLPNIGVVTINCYYLNFDSKGKKLIPQNHKLTISPYLFERQISDLEVIPDSHLPHRDEVRKTLLRNGEKFWSFHGTPAYQYYTGEAWPTSLPTTSQDSIKVIVDYVSASKCDEYNCEEKARRGDAGKDPECPCSLCIEKFAGLKSYAEKARDPSSVCPNDPHPFEVELTLAANREHELEDSFLFCPLNIWAYSLRDKSWKEVEVRGLSNVEPEPDPFKKLVMADQYKRVVVAMVEDHLSKKNAVSDIIKGKGRGLIVLLHGGPGTGKTLTAECVAEKCQRPLYAVTCGDLGTEPDTLEERLRDAFLFAVNWKAILLLDEADVFLQERDLHDLKRNALVSVFLRHLEYYDGLLFLTTNRPGQFDEAFQSRIHITLHLPELDWDGQKAVWRIFLRSLDMEKSEQNILLKFVAVDLKAKLKEDGYKLNGRQIRNCIQSALAISRMEQRPLTKQHILDVVELGQQFSKYMNKINNMDQQQRASSLGFRL
ncbi:hypothetical protein ABW21_db0202270 [Orbilia brochopaga]|nr:hypothetical protein ABW21_db0202270 [Drechslerella brochopaga]